MTLALTNANVVDVRDGTIARGVTVVVEGDRIVGISMDAPADAEIVDAAGGYLVPGFNDMHTHVLNRPDPSGALSLLLAFGVTGYRQMSGSAGLLARRAQGDVGQSPDAPALLHLCGDLLTPLNSGSPDAVAATVAGQRSQGADFVKMGFVGADVYPAAQEAANRVGIPLGGHLPATTAAEDAARAGIRFIEHLGPRLGVLTSCASDAESIRRELGALKGPRLPKRQLPLMDRVFALLLDRLVVNPSLQVSPEEADITRRALDAFDEDRARAVAQVFVEHETWQCPTLIREKTNELGGGASGLDDPNLRYVSPRTVRLWRATERRYRRLPAATRDTFRRMYEAQKLLTRILADEGVPMLAGSDVTGASWEVPGASLHQEFDELAAAGLTPLQVLRMTTSEAARFVERDDFGAVAVGKRADLVLLRGDPTRSVAALHGVRAVVRGGVHYSAADLAGLKERVAAKRDAG